MSDRRELEIGVRVVTSECLPGQRSLEFLANCLRNVEHERARFQRSFEFILAECRFLVVVVCEPRCRGFAIYLDEELARETRVGSRLAGFGCDPAEAVVYNHVREPRLAVNRLRMSTLKFGLERAVLSVD